MSTVLQQVLPRVLLQGSLEMGCSFYAVSEVFVAEVIRILVNQPRELLMHRCQVTAMAYSVPVSD